jgi:hypothetical protein
VSLGGGGRDDSLGHRAGKEVRNGDSGANHSPQTAAVTSLLGADRFASDFLGGNMLTRLSWRRVGVLSGMIMPGAVLLWLFWDPAWDPNLIRYTSGDRDAGVADPNGALLADFGVIVGHGLLLAALGLNTSRLTVSCLGRRRGQFTECAVVLAVVADLVEDARLYVAAKVTSGGVRRFAVGARRHVLHSLEAGGPGGRTV